MKNFIFWAAREKEMIKRIAKNNFKGATKS